MTAPIVREGVKEDDVFGRTQERPSPSLASGACEPARVWFRYEDGRSWNEGEPPQITLRSFPVIDETEKTVRLRVVAWDWDGRHAKRVLKVARKRWAYPTMDLAWQSFKARKTHQRGHLKSQLQHVGEVEKLIGFISSNAPTVAEISTVRHSLIQAARRSLAPPWAPPDAGSQTPVQRDGEAISEGDIATEPKGRAALTEEPKP